MFCNSRLPITFSDGGITSPGLIPLSVYFMLEYSATLLISFRRVRSCSCVGVQFYFINTMYVLMPIEGLIPFHDQLDRFL